MSSLFDLLHRLWVEAQLSAPPFLQKTIIAFFQRAKEIGRLMIKPYFAVDQLQGQSYGGSLVVTYAGLSFARPIIESIFFTEKPAEKCIGRIPFWRISELVDDNIGDITVIAAPKWIIYKLPRRKAFVFPHYVDQILSLKGSWDDVKGRMHKNLRKSEFRRYRKYGYEYEVSHNDEDFEKFYYDMYLPTMNDRHGDLSDPMSLRQARQIFHHGWLLLVRRNGDYVAGGLCHSQENVVLFDLVGVLHCDPQLMREGAQGAAYHAVIHSSHQRGYEAVHFMGCKPYLRGVFQHKRRWGASVRLPDDEHKIFWLKVQHASVAVRESMKENPCIVMNEQGDLQALIVTDGAETTGEAVQNTWRKEFATPGLKGYSICQFDDLLDKLPISSENDIPSSSLSDSDEEPTEN
jgi:hypothetical protein